MVFKLTQLDPRKKILISWRHGKLTTKQLFGRVSKTQSSKRPNPLDMRDDASNQSLLGQINNIHNDLLEAVTAPLGQLSITTLEHDANVLLYCVTTIAAATNNEQTCRC